MILPCGQKKLETVGAQPMTLMIHGQGGNLLALDKSRGSFAFNEDLVI